MKIKELSFRPVYFSFLCMFLNMSPRWLVAKHVHSRNTLVVMLPAFRTNTNLIPVDIKGWQYTVLHLNTQEDREWEGSSDNNDGYENQNPAKTSQPPRVLICRDSQMCWTGVHRGDGFAATPLVCYLNSAWRWLVIKAMWSREKKTLMTSSSELKHSDGQRYTRWCRTAKMLITIWISSVTSVLMPSKRMLFKLIRQQKNSGDC